MSLLVRCAPFREFSYRLTGEIFQNQAIIYVHLRELYILLFYFYLKNARFIGKSSCVEFGSDYSETDKMDQNLAVNKVPQNDLWTLLSYAITLIITATKN